MSKRIRKKPKGRRRRGGGIDAADDRLRDRIQEFAYQPRFKKDFSAALAVFFGEEVKRTRRIVADEEEIPEFQEWYFFDYVIASGDTIIDIFARERGSRLSRTEQKLLDLWRKWNRYRLFEVQDVMPGTGVVVTDLLSEETFEVEDRSASNSLSRWLIILARPIYSDRLHFTGTATLVSPLKKDAVLRYSRQLWETFQTDHPDAVLDEFYRRHGLDIRHFMRRMNEEVPVVTTPEGHLLESAMAYYDVTDADAVFDRLDTAEEFEWAGQSSEHPDADHFKWLQRGRSHVPENEEPVEGAAMRHDVQWFLAPGAPRIRSLGDINLWDDHLEISCLSRARLTAGKALLEEILGELIDHQRDKFGSQAELMTRVPSEASPKSVSDETADAVGRELLAERYEQWPDEPLDPLGGKTPREAVETEEGRAWVLEVLKKMEYFEEQRRLDGDVWYDVNDIRRELGLPMS